MTNADKLLKVSVEEFMSIFNQEKVPKGFEECPAKYMMMFSKIIENFLNKPVKPILTEAEKIILRNIDKKFGSIRRREDNLLYLVEEVDSIYDVRYDFNFFSSLFQFIQPRRRI